MAKNTEKNKLECNVKARKKYKEKNFKYQTVCFKVEEIEAINAYCKDNDVAKNTLLRMAVMDMVGKPFEPKKFTEFSKNTAKDS